MKPTFAPIRVVDVTLTTDDYQYRSPIKFGGVALDRVTVLTATVTVETEEGRHAVGRAAMPLGNVWAFPSSLPYHITLQALRRVADAVAEFYRTSAIFAHPVEITHELEPAFWPAADEVAHELGLGIAIPRLATLVAASPIDAATHDAFGKLHGKSSYQLLGPDALPTDLSVFLGKRFAGRHLNEFVSSKPRESMPLYHLVGALDALTRADVSNPVGDGLPESLDDWIPTDGLTYLKIKLDGADADWDFARVEAVAKIATTHRGDDWHASLDFNERCPSAAALTQFLERLRGDLPAAFARVQYVEQPLPRDLFAANAESVASAARLKPVVVDESLDGPKSLLRAVELGYSGAAFKACKGQTQSLLLAAMASEMGLFRCVQDLTCPGLSLIHSAGLAAHLPGVMAIEANARQYVPSGNAAWDARFPGLFTTRDGHLATGQLCGVGLGG